VSISNGVPWGLSLAAGILFVALGINLQFAKVFQVVDFNLSASGESSVAEIGNIPVYIVKISDNPLCKMPFFL